MNTSEHHLERAEANLNAATELFHNGHHEKARDLLALAQVHAELADAGLVAGIRHSAELIDDNVDTSHIDVRRELDLWVAGSGPEECVASIHANPDWLRNHALNALAIARQLEADLAWAEHRSRR